MRHHNPLLIRNRSWILTIHKNRIFWKNLLENKEIVFKNRVKNIQTAGYNISHMVKSLLWRYHKSITFQIPLLIHLNCYSSCTAGYEIVLDMTILNLTYCFRQSKLILSLKITQKRSLFSASKSTIKFDVFLSNLWNC